MTGGSYCGLDLREGREGTEGSTFGLADTAGLLERGGGL